MASYSVRIKPSPAREVRDLPRKERARLVRRILALASDPRPNGCEKLKGEDTLRVRQSPYRVVYEVNDEEGFVRILKVAHRREIYRGRR